MFYSFWITSWGLLEIFFQMGVIVINGKKYNWICFCCPSELMDGEDDDDDDGGASFAASLTGKVSDLGGGDRLVSDRACVLTRRNL